MKRLISVLLLATTPLYAEPQWLSPTPSFHVKLPSLPSCWISQYCQKSQPILNQIEKQLVKNNNMETKQKTNQNKPKHKKQPAQQPSQTPQSATTNTQTLPLSPPQSQPTTSATNSSVSSNTQQTASHHSHKSTTNNKLFTNTVFLSVSPTHSSWYNNQTGWYNSYENSSWYSTPPIITDINYLYKMGYLPFHVISYTPVGDGYEVTYQWYATHIPNKLVNLSITSTHSIFYRSAILRFMRDYGMHFDPNNTQYASSVLRQAYETGFTAPKPFVWVYVDQHIPQKVLVWQKGKYIFESPANTGVMHTTAVGTFMVYLRFRSTVMEGVFPGTDIHYDDPDVPWVNYFHGGEAIHGFPRRHYGYPQSAGCVELPIYKAKELYPMLYKYAVVTVSRE